MIDKGKNEGTTFSDGKTETTRDVSHGAVAEVEAVLMTYPDRLPGTVRRA
jgi:hypothetical protein